MKKLLLLIIPLIFASCHSKQNKMGIVPEVQLKGVSIYTNYQDSYFAFLTLYGDTLFLKSQNTDSLINVCKIKGDSIIRTNALLSKGNGPHELIYFKGYFDDNTKKLFIINGSGTGLINCLRIDATKDKLLKSSLWKNYKLDNVLNMNYTYSGSVSLSDSLLLLCGGKRNDRNIISVLNIYNQQVTPVNFWPDDHFKGNSFVKQSVYIDNSVLRKNEVNHRFLYVCKNSKYAVIFTLDKNFKINIIKTLYDIYPKYKMMEDGLNYIYGSDYEPGFAVTSTNHYIYLRPEAMRWVKGGKNEYKGYPYNYGDVVYVFDWDGKMVKELHFDIPFLDFIVNKDDKLMYVSTFNLKNEDAIIKRYAL